MCVTEHEKEGLPKRWERVRRESPVNVTRVATYERLTHAETRITEARRSRGESRGTIEPALAGSELSDAELEADDIYLACLTRFVAAPGGHVEVLAVFPEETITVRRDPDARFVSGMGFVCTIWRPRARKLWRRPKTTPMGQVAGWVHSRTGDE